MDKISLVEKKYLKKDIPKFKVGDTLRVYVKIVEQEKSRLQQFEGIVIRQRGSGLKHTFTLRRVSYGEGIERIFLTNSPYLDKIELVKAGKVSRARLYYLRKKIGKKGKIEEKKEEELLEKPVASSGQEAKTSA